MGDLDGYQATRRRAERFLERNLSAVTLNVPLYDFQCPLPGPHCSFRPARKVNGRLG
jgi:hypothetical protein